MKLLAPLALLIVIGFMAWAYYKLHEPWIKDMERRLAALEARRRAEATCPHGDHYDDCPDCRH